LKESGLKYRRDGSNYQPTTVKSLNKAKRNYCASRRVLTIVTLEHFHKYFYGQEFQLRIDHSALTDPRRKGWMPPKPGDIEVPNARTNTCHRHVPSGKKKWGYTCRLLGMNSVKEEVMWHVG
jgi:hypothetical protein